MSYGSRLKRELEKYPQLIELVEAAMQEARRFSPNAGEPPRIPLADKILEAMEQDRRDNGSIVSLRLDGQGWSAHILDPELEGISSKGGYPDPEAAWESVQERRKEKTEIAKNARRRTWGAGA